MMPPYSYFDGAVRRLQERKADDLAEVNKAAPKHILALAVDENDKFYGCGCEFADGKLRIIFAPDALGSNSNTALQADKLDKALNEAPAPDGESEDILSFNAKKDVRESFDPKIGAVQEEAATILKNPDIKLIANIEENYTKLKAESEVKDTGMIKHWEGSIGSACLDYFVSFNKALVRQKFDSDDMMQEGFAEAVPKGEVVLRIVDGPLDSACNCVIEDGVLYLQVRRPSRTSLKLHLAVTRTDSTPDHGSPVVGELWRCREQADRAPLTIWSHWGRVNMLRIICLTYCKSEQSLGFG